MSQAIPVFKRAEPHWDIPATDLTQPLRWINRITTGYRARHARWIAIAHPMALGDVVAALPLAGILKTHFPQASICFIGNAYARPLIECCEHIDRFLECDAVTSEPSELTRLGVDIFLNPFPNQELAIAAHQARVPIRVGNLRRMRTIQYCNRFVMYSRRNSGRHEIDLNLESLAGLGLPTRYPLSHIHNFFGLNRHPELHPEWSRLLDPGKVNVIFHPKSNKNGREWPAGHYLQLARSLPQDRYHIFLTGREHERDVLWGEIPAIFQLPHVTDLCGKLPLQQFLAFISKTDGLVASGTGPLHVAAAMHKHALGIFPPRADIDPNHWAPVGIKGEYLSLGGRCLPVGNCCPRDFAGGPCACTAAIAPQQVMERVLTWHPAV